MANSKHLIIGFTPEMSVEEVVDCLKADFCGLGNYDPDHNASGVRRHDIHAAFNLCSIRHLGIGDVDEFEKVLVDACDVVNDLFFGAWWNSDEPMAMKDRFRKMGIFWFD